jgi:polysaccharide biosynthesis/export protein
LSKLTCSVLLILCSLPLGCSGGTRLDPAAYAQAYDPRKHPYVIGVSDVLQIDVWKNPNLSTEAPVRPDGTLTMPLVGELRAAGKTTGQLKDEITRYISGYVKNTVVTVAVKEVNSYRFTVTGNVETSGMFSARSYVTISEAIALAGGPNRYASSDEVVIIRAGSDGRLRRIPIDYDAILSGKHPEQDIVVLRGDNVHVP